MKPDIDGEPVPLHRGHLIGTGILAAGAYFAQGQDGWFWPITSNELQVTVYPPGTLVTFRKATASDCR